MNFVYYVACYIAIGLLVFAASQLFCKLTSADDDDFGDEKATVFGCSLIIALWPFMLVEVFRILITPSEE